MNDRRGYVCKINRFQAMKLKLGEQIVFSGSVNATLRYTKRFETDFVPRYKHRGYE